MSTEMQKEYEDAQKLVDQMKKEREEYEAKLAEQKKQLEAK